MADDSSPQNIQREKAAKISESLTNKVFSVYRDAVVHPPTQSTQQPDEFGLYQAEITFPSLQEHLDTYHLLDDVTTADKRKMHALINALDEAKDKTKELDLVKLKEGAVALGNIATHIACEHDKLNCLVPPTPFRDYTKKEQVESLEKYCEARFKSATADISNIQILDQHTQNILDTVSAIRGVTPNNVRNEAAKKATKILTKPFKYYLRVIYDGAPVGERLALSKRESYLRGFLEAVGSRYFFGDTGNEEVKKRVEKKILEEYGIDDAHQKFMTIVDTIDNIRDLSKPVDVTALKTGYLALKAIYEKAQEVVEEKRTLVNPENASAEAVNTFVRLVKKEGLTPDTDDPQELRERLEKASSAIPGVGRIYHNTIEQVQSGEAESYVRYNALAIGLRNLKEEMEGIMHSLSISVPEKGDVRRNKK